MELNIIPIISDPYYIKSTWFNEIISGMTEASKKSRNQLVLKVYSEPIKKIDLSELPPVVIVTNGSQNYILATIRALVKADKNIVLSGLDSQNFGEFISCITSSRQTDMERLIYYLVVHGRKRIALVGFWQESINDMTFYRSAVEGAKHFDIQIPGRAIYFWEDTLEECLSSFIRDAKKYDTVICPNDTIACSLIEICKENGIRIPQDLYLTGISNMLIGRYIEPSLTTISMDFFRIGEETVNAWIHMKENLSNPSYLRILVPGKLVIRESTDNQPEIPHSYFKGISNKFSDSIDNNKFFTESSIKAKIQIENCLHQRDELDTKIICGIMQGKTYEKLAEELFISISAVRYRRKKIFKDAGVDNREDFEHLIKNHLGRFY